MIEGLLQPAHLVFVLVVPLILFVLPFWRILAKAGYPAPLSLLALFPPAGVLLLFWLKLSGLRAPKHFLLQMFMNSEGQFIKFPRKNENCESVTGSENK